MHRKLIGLTDKDLAAIQYALHHTLNNLKHNPSKEMQEQMIVTREYLKFFN